MSSLLHLFTILDFGSQIPPTLLRIWFIPLGAIGHLLKLLNVLGCSAPKHLTKSEERNLHCLKIAVEH